MRLSGPLLDRIDLHVHVAPVKLAELRAIEPAEPSAALRARVVAARDRQRARLAGFGVRCNAEMTSAVLRATCKLDADGERKLAELVERQQSVTARGIDRLIKVARTIADLTGLDAIDGSCLTEATMFRGGSPVAAVLANVA